MDITQYIEQNPTLMRVGLFFEFNDARSRVATQLQKNIDRSKILYSFHWTLNTYSWLLLWFSTSPPALVALRNDPSMFL